MLATPMAASHKAILPRVHIVMTDGGGLSRSSSNRGDELEWKSPLDKLLL
jgi:hypothetical protein